jgi:uncharacterized protein (TIGR03118 family)
MKTSSCTRSGFVLSICFTALSAMLCTKASSPSSSAEDIQKVDLVSDTTEFAGARTDANLKNAWGIGFDNDGTMYVASNHAGAVVVYNSGGIQAMSPIIVPPRSPTDAGAPSGLGLNTTGSFIVPGSSNPAKFIVVTEDGLVAAWNTGTTAVVVDTGDTDAVYKGVAIASDNGANFIYATNFHGGKVDVYDSAFGRVSTKHFADASIPVGFTPFNIALIDGNLYVTYAKPKPPDFADDTAGPGNGYVDIFKTDGTLLNRFVSQGMLNSPWGIAKAPPGFGNLADKILIGDFGDGLIHVYDNSGMPAGTVRTGSGDTIKVKGLWAIGFPPQSSSLSSTIKNYLYFSAGPNEENNGLFGYLYIKPAPVSTNPNPYRY